MRKLRQKIRGWALNTNAMYRRKKKELLAKLNEIDKNAEVMGLCAHDRNLQIQMRKELNDLLKEEELKWLQRYKDRDIKEGDQNSRYYHAKANGRRRKKLPPKQGE